MVYAHLGLVGGQAVVRQRQPSEPRNGALAGTHPADGPAARQVNALIFNQVLPAAGNRGRDKADCAARRLGSAVPCRELGLGRWYVRRIRRAPDDRAAERGDRMLT